MTPGRKSPKIRLMADLGHIKQRLSAVIFLVALSSCAVPYTPSPPAVKADRQELMEVFAAGYRNITEKYIESVSAESIALNGLGGFSSIDPALKIERLLDMVTLTYSGMGIKTIKAPDADNIIGWAALTSDMTTAAKHASLDMGAASKEKVFEAVFDGVLSSLDIFSRYAGAEEATKNRARRDGFGGIGITFKAKYSRFVITSVLPATPADKAGLKTGDVITEIGGKPLAGLDSDDVVSLLHGPTQTSVSMTIRRSEPPVQQAVTLTRTHIVPITVTEKRNHGILYFKISSFNQDTAHALASKLTTAKIQMGEDLKGIVIDLRGNPGGLLKQSVKVADLLLTHGGIVSTRGRHLDSLHNYEADGRDLADGLPVVVLIDGKSASAAEIVAAALQDRNRAVVVGTSSYGKGTVQTVIRLPNSGEITLTWSRFMAPSGYPLHGLGVRPVVCTSTPNSSVENAIKKALMIRPELKATYESWRIPALQPKETRVKLRQTCPPEKHKSGTEIEVAKQILDDASIYEKTLDLSAGSVQARK